MVVWELCREVTCKGLLDQCVLTTRAEGLDTEGKFQVGTEKESDLFKDCSGVYRGVGGCLLVRQRGVVRQGKYLQVYAAPTPRPRHRHRPETVLT